MCVYSLDKSILKNKLVIRLVLLIPFPYNEYSYVDFLQKFIQWIILDNTIKNIFTYFPV